MPHTEIPPTLRTSSKNNAPATRYETCRSVGNTVAKLHRERDEYALAYLAGYLARRLYQPDHAGALPRAIDTPFAQELSYCISHLSKSRATH